MTVLTEAAKLARITAYKETLRQKLARRIIDTDKPEFAHLINDKGKLMSSLNGEVLLEIDQAEDGSLRGVVSVTLDSLAAMLPELKNDTEDKMGWKGYLIMLEAEGIDNILHGVADPAPDEYEAGK